MASADNILYDPLLSEDVKEEFDDIPRPRSSRRPLLKIFILVVITVSTLFTTVFIAVGAAIAHHKAHNTSSGVEIQEPEYESCGRTPEEARSRGCTFDVISFSWLTPECYDESLTNDFINWDDWVWYTDESLNVTMSLEQAKLGEQNALVGWHYHVVHCTFMWIQMHRGLERGWIGHHLQHYDHTLHCQHTFLQNPEANLDVLTPARVIYPKCLRVGVEDGMYPGPRFIDRND